MAYPNVAIVDQVPEQLPAFADGARLGGVVRELLDNACRYSAAGGTVELVARVLDEGVVVTVTDRGEGLDRAMLSAGLRPALLDRRGDAPQGAVRHRRRAAPRSPDRGRARRHHVGRSRSRAEERACRSVSRRARVLGWPPGRSARPEPRTRDHGWSHSARGRRPADVSSPRERTTPGAEPHPRSRSSASRPPAVRRWARRPHLPRSDAHRPSHGDPLRPRRRRPRERPRPGVMERECRSTPAHDRASSLHPTPRPGARSARGPPGSLRAGSMRHRSVSLATRTTWPLVVRSWRRSSRRPAAERSARSSWWITRPRTPAARGPHRVTTSRRPKASVGPTGPRGSGGPSSSRHRATVPPRSSASRARALRGHRRHARLGARRRDRLERLLSTVRFGDAGSAI